MENVTTDTAPSLDMPGAFAETLRRSNRKIRDDRAQAIVETTELIYKRTVEDIETEIKQLKRRRENKLDLSPTTADSLTLADNFDAAGFVSEDIKIGLSLRELEIKLQVATERYNKLFKASV
jgi:hypothetical protein